MTTQPGAERVRELLLNRRHGMFHRFCKEFALPPGSIRFDPSCILVPQPPGGKPLEDVRTPPRICSLRITFCRWCGT